MQSDTIAEALDLDDLLFESRNRNYGAYELRKHYKDRMTAALLSAVILFLGVLLLLPRDNAMKKMIIDNTPIELKPWGTLPRPQTDPQVEPTTASHSDEPSYYARQVDHPTDLLPDKPQTGGTEGTEGTNTGNPLGNGTEQTGSSGMSPAPDTVQSKPESFPDFADENPEFPGGFNAMEKYLQNNIQYPTFALDNRIQGTIFIALKIKANGEIAGAELIKGINRLCDEEALRVVEAMPRWIPGKNNGRPVPVRCIIRVKMQLE